MKRVLFTHDDLDGAGCRILFEIANRRFGNDYVVINSHNNTIDNNVRKYISEHPEAADIYFADICCSEELLKSIAADMMPSSKDGSELVHVYDHHVTNKFAEDIPGVDTIIYTDKEHSGANILLQTNICGSLWFNPLIERFTNTVMCWDTFLWKDNPNLVISQESRILNEIFHVLGMEVFCKFYIDKFSENLTGEDIVPDKYLRNMAEEHIKKEDEIIEEFVNSNPETFEFHYIRSDGCIHLVSAAYFICTGQMNISTAMNKYLEFHPDIDVAVMYMPQHRTLSLRTIKDDVNVADICKMCGGGGHPKAAGMPAPDIEEQTSTFIKFYIEKKYLNSPLAE